MTKTVDAPPEGRFSIPSVQRVHTFHCRRNWAAAVTSVIGASYTSVSFITKTDGNPRRRNLLTVAFIAVCAVVFLFLGQAPQTLLIFAGAFNGLILPIGFGVLLWVALRRRDLLGGYAYPTWLAILGVVVWILTAFLAVVSFGPAIDLMTGA